MFTPGKTGVWIGAFGSLCFNTGFPGIRHTMAGHFCNLMGRAIVGNTAWLSPRVNRETIKTKRRNHKDM